MTTEPDTLRSLVSDVFAIPEADITDNQLAAITRYYEGLVPEKYVTAGRSSNDLERRIGYNAAIKEMHHRIKDDHREVK